MKYRYRTRARAHGNWSDWVETNGPNLVIDMEHVESVDYETVAEPCVEIPPVTFDGKGFTCDGIDGSVCKVIGFHRFKLDGRVVRWDA